MYFMIVLESMFTKTEHIRKLEGKIDRLQQSTLDFDVENRRSSCGDSNKEFVFISSDYVKLYRILSC